MTRAPVKLSREMKLLLLLLLMVGLIGLWYVLTNKPATGDLAQQPTPPATTGTGTGTGAATPGAGSATPGNPDAVPITTPTTPGTPAAGSTGAAGTPLTVQPDSQVQVETIPPFPTDGGAATTTTPAPEAVTPGGINPDGVIASAPGSNPFKPLRLDASPDGSGTGTPASSPAVSAPTTQPVTSGQVTATVPARPVTPAVDSLGNGGGALGLSPIPGADGSVGVGSGSVSGGALPVPVIPGADGSAGTAATPVVVPVTPEGGSATSSPTSGSPTSGGATPVIPGTPGTVVLTPPAPVKPPVVGVNVPGVVTRLPDVVAAAPATGTAGTGTAASGAATTALPTPGTPQVIRELTQGSAAAVTGPATTTLSALEQYVQNHNLVFNAVVLGPINTAIFRGTDGYVVVASGQPLPDSKVVVGDVTATSATLNLGTDSKTLDLDKR